MGSPTDWKVTGSRRLTYRSERSEPHLKPPHVGIWHLGARAPGASGIEGQWGLCAEAPRDWGSGDPILGRRTQAFPCTGSQGKAGSRWESGLDVPAVLGGPPGKAGVNVACCGGRTLEAKLSGIFISCGSLEGAILGKSGPTHQR